MNREFWQSRWEQGKIGFHQQQINPHLKRFWANLGVSSGQVFVPLCGKSQDMLWLCEQGHAVLGVEIVPQAVEAFFAEHMLEAKIQTLGNFVVWESHDLQIYCGDFFALERPTLSVVVAVYDRAALIAMPSFQRASYVQHLRAVLPAAAKILLVVMDYPQHEMKGPPFAVEVGETEDLFGEGFLVQQIYAEDILAADPKFRDKGLSYLEERIYVLNPLP